MSADVQIWPVRHSHYYGGDLWVERTSDDFDEPGAAIIWEVWGGYGKTAIALTADEARQLSRGLLGAIGDIS